MLNGRKIAVVVPALNEALTIEAVVASMPDFVDKIVVADNGSTDGTAELAQRAGATVARSEKRGYGAACQCAIGLLKRDPPDIVVFTAGDGSDDPCQMHDLVRPLLEGDADLCMASRRMGVVEAGSMTWSQTYGTRLAVWLLNAIWKCSYSDLGPYRAICWHVLNAMRMEDEDFGWTIEMQIKAARMNLKVKEIPARYRRRIGGTSKIGGTVKGTLLAGKKILWWISKEAIKKG